MSRVNFTSICLLSLALAGCAGADNALVSLEAELGLAIARFENADANFGPATNYDELIANGHWLDRMGEEILKIERIEDRAILLGADPNPEIRKAVVSRFRRRLASLQSDAEYLNAMSSLEIAKIWLEM